MNMLTVKPMPQSMAIPDNEAQVAPSGNCTIFAFTLSQHAIITPENFPITKPRNTPSPTPWVRLSMLMPSKHTPALAKANMGIMSMLIGLRSTSSASCNVDMRWSEADSMARRSCISVCVSMCGVRLSCAVTS